MKHLIQLVESAEQLAEAPIDDFSKDPAGMPDDPSDAGIGQMYATMGLGFAAPWFMDIGMVGQIVASVVGGVLGAIIGAVLGSDWEAPHYYKVRKTSAKKIANAPITTEIRSDLRTFMNQMLNSIPDSISKYAIELKNVDAYADGTLGAPYDYESKKDLNARTEVIAKLLKDYLEKQNKAFDELAKKHNLKPTQLGAMAYIVYGETIEQAFVKKLQSKISD
jgi:ABC-type Zn2+ transport system substrate-binding protein/surface adhesin